MVKTLKVTQTKLSTFKYIVKKTLQIDTSASGPFHQLQTYLAFTISKDPSTYFTKVEQFYPFNFLLLHIFGLTQLTQKVLDSIL